MQVVPSGKNSSDIIIIPQKIDLKKPRFSGITMLKPKDISELKSIGRGSFGEIFTGTYLGGKVIVKKCLKCESDDVYIP
eukprot:UN09489